MFSVELAYRSSSLSPIASLLSIGCYKENQDNKGQEQNTEQNLSGVFHRVFPIKKGDNHLL